MRKVKIYMDNCCYNRPYDDQTQPKVIIETLAKLHIQKFVLNKELDLVWSYILKFENSQNISEAKRDAIAKWEKLSIEFIGKSDPLIALAREVENAGVKVFDALHVACAITAKCDYFITVDKSLLKYQDNRIIICNPMNFIIMEAEDDQ